MKKILLIVTLVLSFFESAIYTNAQVVYEAVTDEIKMNDSFVELLQTNPNLIYEKYDNVIDIQKVTLEESQVQEYVEAYEQSVDGVIEEINCEVTLNKIICEDNASVLYSVNESTSTYYVLSATATSKTSEDTLSDDDVTLYGCIGWKDNLGMKNEFEYVSGSRSGSYSGTGYYQASHRISPLCYGNFERSFYSTSNVEDTSGEEFRLLVRTPTASGTTIYLDFGTSMLD